MFDDFKNSQFIAYSLLVNSIKNGKMSHAYLIDGNNNEYAFDFVMALVKMIVCNNHYSSFDNCGSCNKCKRIQDGNYTELKIIESDSLIIKKDQLLELQSEFSRSGIEDSRRIYVIKDCDKMNKQASNCLLKFLEEPNEGIIAILFTNNINNVLTTIVSRCQIIRLVKDRFFYQGDALTNLAYLCCDTKNDIEKFVKDESKKNLVCDIIDFISYYEENGLDVMVYLKKMWYNKFSNREDSMMAILMLVYFYYDVLKFKYSIDDYFFGDYLNVIEVVSNNNEINQIINKIDLCIESSENLKYNLNVNLLLDDLLIRLGE